MNSKV